MAGKKIIVVIGATGAQGGGLARAIAADSQGEFTARAVTRKLDSDPARALAAAGIEVGEVVVSEHERRVTFTSPDGVVLVAYERLQR